MADKTRSGFLQGQSLLKDEEDQKGRHSLFTAQSGRASDERYGCCCLLKGPRCLQSVNKMAVFVACTVFLCFVEGYAVNGMVNAARPHIEKQFGMTSSRSALITSAQDIGALCVVILVSYIGSNPQYNKARWVAVGSVLMALGSLVFMVPHIILSASNVGSGPPPSGICDLSNSTSSANASDVTDPPSSSSSDLVHYLGVFMAANLLHGMGFCPMFTVGTVYIDENEKPNLAAVYIGMTYAAAAVGVALGFFVGGQFTERFYVDFDRVDQDSLGFGPRDSPWVGAWWLGFIPSALAFLLIALPIFGFPKRLPGRPHKVPSVATTGDKYVTDGENSTTRQTGGTVVNFFRALLRLLLNPTFVFLCLGGSTEALVISGISSFSFKYLVEQYDMTFDSAGNLLGGLILYSATGMVLGGVVIKCFKLQAPGMLRMNALIALFTSLMGFTLMAACPDVRLAGLEVSYPNASAIAGWSSPCQGACECSDVSYNPVCGPDLLVYYSPCHAGCVGVLDPGPMESYTNCSCIATQLLMTNSSVTSEPGDVASRGRCSTDCWGLYLAAPALFVMLQAVLITTTPTSMATLRVVPPELKSFALGIQWTLLRLLGTIPSPPLVGRILDSSCHIWQTAPDGTSYCALYSKSKMATSLSAWWVGVNALAATFFLLAALCLRCTRARDEGKGQAVSTLDRKL